MIRTALLSRWHVHADDYAKEALKNDNVKLVAVWDEDASRGAQFAEDYNLSYIASLDELLQQDDIDAVIVTTPTAHHPRIIREALVQGKHVFTEKVLALSVETCKALYQLADDNHVQLMVSLPRLSSPVVQYAQAAVANGWLGQLHTVRCRVHHDGALVSNANPTGWLPSDFFREDLCGGGAFVDLGAHPIYLCNRFGGNPLALSARLASLLGHPVDDHAVAMVTYESGVIGMMEAGFISGVGQFVLELHGTVGSLLIEDETARLRSLALGQNAFVPVTDLPEALPTPMVQWIDAIQHGTMPIVTRGDVLKLTAVNEAARQSSEQSRQISVAF